MPKRKKYPRLPNSYGTIRYLGKGRTLPYAVHPPAKDRDTNGNYIRPTALCYVPDWYTGFGVLSAYHAGTYTPGMELTIKQDVEQCRYDLDGFCRMVLRNNAIVTGMPSTAPTLKEVYESFVRWKFEDSATKQYSKSSKAAYAAGFKWLSDLHDTPVDRITVDELQRAVNECPKKKATKELIVLAAKQIYKYALPRHLCEEDPARHLVVPTGGEDEHGRPFSVADLKKLWELRSNPTAEMLLIMCYSGFRITAYKTLEVNMDNLYFKGGIKTAAGKGRIVPIHSAIVPLVRERLARDGTLMDSTQHFRNQMLALTDAHGLTGKPKHTPHDCRHTFSMLCESHGVREADRKRMLGHAFGGDITNDVYGHRSIDELRTEIEKIPAPKDL